MNLERSCYCFWRLTGATKFLVVHEHFPRSSLGIPACFPNQLWCYCSLDNIFLPSSQSEGARRGCLGTPRCTFQMLVQKSPVLLPFSKVMQFSHEASCSLIQRWIHLGSSLHDFSHVLKCILTEKEYSSRPILFLLLLFCSTSSFFFLLPHPVAHRALLLSDLRHHWVDYRTWVGSL